MLYICQRDYDHIPYPTFTAEPDNEEGKHTTIKTSGCGLCSCIMVADRLLPNCTFGLEDAISLAFKCEANYASGTSMRRFAPAFAEHMGLRYEKNNNIEDLKNCLRTGGAAVALVNERDDYHSVFTTVGHYIAIVGLTPDGKFMVLDSDEYEGKFEEEGRIGRVTHNGHLVYATEELLMAETDLKPEDRFNLFWLDEK